MGQAQSGSGRSAAAMAIIGVGVFLLLAQFGVFSFNLMGLLWPFFIIIPGLAFLYPAWKGGPDTAPLAIPGAIITGTGALLLLQSVTGRWESWAYVWTLYPVFLALPHRQPPDAGLRARAGALGADRFRDFRRVL